MRTTCAIAFLGAALLLATTAPVHAQAREETTKKPPRPVGRLADGQPDVQGIWGATRAGSVSLTNPISAAQDFENADLKLPSRIIDPPDGQVPYQPWAAAKRNQQAIDYAWPTKPEHIDTQHRCFLSGVPRLYTIVPTYKIVQTPGQVIFIWSEYHAFRVIPLDNRPHPPSNVKLWMCDARGRWEGNTLIVDTSNVLGARLTYTGDFYSDNAHVAERFTFPDADRMIYEATVTDPTVFTRPWTMRVEHTRRANEEVWEAACVEGITSPDEFLIKDATQKPTARPAR
jgi:hypothetical protein